MDDLISRQAAIRWVKTECNPYGKPTLDFESGKKVIEHLEQMSSAEKKGEWTDPDIVERGVIEVWQSMRCSECGRYHTTPYLYSITIFDYCPNCGAKMEK